MYQKFFTNKGMLPLLISLLLLLSSASILLGYFLISAKQKYYLQHACRITALESMQILADGINKLIEMNPKAIRLQVKFKRAQVLIKTATTPPQVAAALLYLKKVKLEQMVFRKKQLSTIARTERTANLKISSKTKKSSIISFNHITLQLLPAPPNSGSPIYTAYTGYERNQAVHIKWSKKNSVNSKELKNDGSCSATVSKEKKWYPKLTKGRAS